MHAKISPEKASALKLAKQASGTIKKVIEMIEQDEYCMDVLQQAGSVAGLLSRMRGRLLEGHLKHCLEEKLKEDKDKTLKELLKIYNLSN